MYSMSRRRESPSRPPLAHANIAAASQQALRVLRGCCHPAGLKGSAGSPGHTQVWARDAMISLLGARNCGDEQIQRALHASLDTLRRRQSPAGAIPNHIDTVTGRPNFRAYADSGLWYVIGSTLVQPDLESIRRVLRWYRCQDVDATGLISMQEASDWEDLLCTRGIGLTVNCLYAIALERAAALARSLKEKKLEGIYRKRAETVRAAVNRILWYRGDGQMVRHIAHSFSTPNPEHDSLGRRRWMPQKRKLIDSRYYLPYVAFREPGEWFDSFGNLLAVLSGVAAPPQTGDILDFISKRELASHPIRAIDPPIERGDPEWRAYYGTLNSPGQYHNGGIWPFLGGFYVAALVKAGCFDKAEDALIALAELNCRGDFCEWHHAETLEPLGVREQAWSAGMFLFAVECVAKRSVPL